jgi:hypothetical protein
MINPGDTWQPREAGPDGGGAEGCPIPLPLPGMPRGNGRSGLLLIHKCGGRA